MYLGEMNAQFDSDQFRQEERLVKRSLDVLVTLALSPALIVASVIVAIVIKLDSRGPVLFRQERIGLGNKKFRIIKFRTMYADAQRDPTASAVARRDPRVTRVGTFLRKTSLDELPQFLNVLMGDMSIVGPRPHTADTAVGERLLGDIDPAYWLRHMVKPGITGLAQVRGYRGSLFEEQQFRDRLNSDLEYIESWSLLADLKIIFRTTGILIHRNAF